MGEGIILYLLILYSVGLLTESYSVKYSKYTGKDRLRNQQGKNILGARRKGINKVRTFQAKRKGLSKELGKIQGKIGARRETKIKAPPLLPGDHTTA